MSIDENSENNSELLELGFMFWKSFSSSSPANDDAQRICQMVLPACGDRKPMSVHPLNWF